MKLLNSLRDDELVTLLKQGDEAAFSEIYERHWLKLYNESHKRLKDEALCADVIQDVVAGRRLRFVRFDEAKLHARNAIDHRLSIAHCGFAAECLRIPGLRLRYIPRSL